MKSLIAVMYFVETSPFLSLLPRPSIKGLVLNKVIYIDFCFHGENTLYGS